MTMTNQPGFQQFYLLVSLCKLSYQLFGFISAVGRRGADNSSSWRSRSPCACGPTWQRPVWALKVLTLGYNAYLRHFESVLASTAPCPLLKRPMLATRPLSAAFTSLQQLRSKHIRDGAAFAVRLLLAPRLPATPSCCPYCNPLMPPFSLPGFATLSSEVATGLNILKKGSDPPLKPDDQLPEWLWGLAEPGKTLNELRRTKEADMTDAEVG